MMKDAKEEKTESSKKVEDSVDAKAVDDDVSKLMNLSFDKASAPTETSSMKEMD